MESGVVITFIFVLVISISLTSTAGGEWDDFAGDGNESIENNNSLDNTEIISTNNESQDQQVVSRNSSNVESIAESEYTINFYIAMWGVIFGLLIIAYIVYSLLNRPRSKWR